MKKLILFLTFTILSITNLYSQVYDGRVNMGNSAMKQRTDFYLPNTPTNTDGNRIVTAYIKGTHKWWFNQDTITINKLAYSVDRIAIIKANGDISAISNNFLTSESDPGVPSWAKASTKPSYSYSEINSLPNLFSGSYLDLTNKPNLFSGNYTDLTNKPLLFSGAYSDLTGKPTLFSGSYLDLTNKPSIPTSLSQLTNDTGYITSVPAQTWISITGKPTFSTVATSGSYNDLLNKPTIPSVPTVLSAFTNDTNFITNTNLTSSLSSYATTSSVTSGLATKYDSSNPSSYIDQSGARSSISLTTTGSGNATYNSSTGVLNIPTPVIAKVPTPYTGVTNSSGLYTVIFPVAYSVAPNIQVNLIGGTNKETWITTSSATGFTIKVESRNDVLGLLPTYSLVNGRTVDVLVTEK